MSDYPTEEDLERLARWPDGDLEGWFAHARSLWRWPEWGWREEMVADDDGRPVFVYQVSTGGWSGNESILDAMRAHPVHWLVTWYDHRRGGHYEFRRKNEVT